MNRGRRPAGRLSAVDIVRGRLHNQRLSGEPFDEAKEAVTWLAAVQAQDYFGAKWALALRMQDASDPTLDRAFEDGSILRTHVLRPTWHFVAPEDIRWLLALTAPRVHKVNGTMYRRHELDERTRSTAGDVLAKALEGGQHLTREELAEELERAGIAAPSGPRLAYLVMHAELEGLICSGPRHGKQFTYALLDERVPPVKALSREEALHELALRYFSSRGPATVHDFAKWSGLTVGDARAGLESVKDRLDHEQMNGRAYWFSPWSPTGEPDAQMSSPAAGAPHALMLSIYDEYISGYKDRSAIIDARGAKLLTALGNALTNVIVIDGRIVGTWRRTFTSSEVVVETKPFDPLSKDQKRAVAAALEKYAAFLGLRGVWA